MYKTIKNIFVTFATAIFTIFVIYGGYSIYAAGQYDFAEPIMGFSYVKASYNYEMNEYFNEKLKGLYDVLESDNKIDDRERILFEAPANAELCTDDNLSSYCVGIGALDMYIEYIKTLDELQASLPSGFLYEDAQQLIASTNERDYEVNQEYDDAAAIMEATVAAYNEFRLAYPMHKKYESIINNLIKYKIALEKIRQDVTGFPLNFIDSTSSQCE